MKANKIKEILSNIDYWTSKYEINFQFWGDYENNVFISKNDVNIYSNGGFKKPIDAMEDALKWINKVNPINSPRTVKISQ